MVRTRWTRCNCADDVDAVDLVMNYADDVDMVDDVDAVGTRRTRL